MNQLRHFIKIEKDKTSRKYMSPAGEIEEIDYPKTRFREYDERGKAVHSDTALGKRSQASLKYQYEQRMKKSEKNKEWDKNLDWQK